MAFRLCDGRGFFLWFWFFYLRFGSHPPVTHLTAGVSRKRRRRRSRRIRLMHNSWLVRRLRLKFGIGARHLRVFPALWHGPDAQTQVRGHKTWNQQNAEQDNQRGGETDSGHADHWRTWFNGPGGENHSVGGRAVCRVIERER